MMASEAKATCLNCSARQVFSSFGHNQFRIQALRFFKMPCSTTPKLALHQHKMHWHIIRDIVLQIVALTVEYNGLLKSMLEGWVDSRRGGEGDHIGMFND